MTPFQIRILLAAYITDSWEDDFKEMWHTGTWQSTIEEFIADGLLSEHKQSTSRLNAYVEAICGLPLPVQVWVMPKERDNA